MTERVSYGRIIRDDRVATALLFALVVLPFAWWQARSGKAATEAVLILFVVLGGALLYRVWDIAGLSQRGIPIIGRVITIDWRRSMWFRTYEPFDPMDRVPDHAFVTMRYSVNGREYTTGRTLTKRAASNLTPGAELPLRVDGKKPWRFVFE